MGRPADPSRKAELHERVVNHVLEQGLSDLSLRPLAAAIGTSPRTLLYHYGSKEKLVTAALEGARAKERELFEAWVRVHDAHDEASLAAALCHAWEWLSQPEAAPFLRLFFEVYGAALERRTAYSGFLDGVVRDWLPVFAAPARRQGLEPAEADELATLLIATLRGCLLDLLATGERERVNAALGRFHRLLTLAEASVG